MFVEKAVGCMSLWDCDGLNQTALERTLGQSLLNGPSVSFFRNENPEGPMFGVSGFKTHQCHDIWNQKPQTLSPGTLWEMDPTCFCLRLKVVWFPILRFLFPFCFSPSELDVSIKASLLTRFRTPLTFFAGVVTPSAM